VSQMSVTLQSKRHPFSARLRDVAPPGCTIRFSLIYLIKQDYSLNQSIKDSRSSKQQRAKQRLSERTRFMFPLWLAVTTKRNGMEVKAKAGSSTGEQRRPAKRRRRALPTCAPAKAATTFGLQSPPSPPPPPPPRPPEEEPGGGGGGSQGKEGRGSSSHDAMGTTTVHRLRAWTHPPPPMTMDYSF